MLAPFGQAALVGSSLPTPSLKTSRTSLLGGKFPRNSSLEALAMEHSWKKFRSLPPFQRALGLEVQGHVLRIAWLNLLYQQIPGRHAVAFTRRMRFLPTVTVGRAMPEVTSDRLTSCHCRIRQPSRGPMAIPSIIIDKRRQRPDRAMSKPCSLCSLDGEKSVRENNIQNAACNE